MSRETSKGHARRIVEHHYDRFLTGKGIDIGSGDDPLVVPHGVVDPWDRGHGDAQQLAGVSDCSYDFVYSSHCLEHMHDIAQSLFNWVRICRTLGHLYIVVPDYTLYEKNHWPSRFNHDHKHSFSLWLRREKVSRSNHWHIADDFDPLLKSLGSNLRLAELQDDGYDYNNGFDDQTIGAAMAQICLVAQKL